MEYMQDQQDKQAAESQGHSPVSNSSDSGDGDSMDGGMDESEMFDDDGNMLPEIGDELREDIVETQDHFDGKQQQLLGDKAKSHHERIYFTLPEPNLKSVLIPYKTIIERLGKEVEHMDKEAEGHYAAETEFYHRRRIHVG